MQRKIVTADELIHLINERLRERDVIATSHAAVAIVPHVIHSWAVVIPGAVRNKEPKFVARVEKIQAELRKRYALVD